MKAARARDSRRPLMRPPGVPARAPLHPGQFLQKHYLGPLGMTQTETSKKSEMADLVAQHLRGESYHPVADGMTAEREMKAVMDTENMQTQTTEALRDEEEFKNLTDENRQMQLALRE